MKNELANSPANRIGNKIRFSLVLKLNSKLFFHMLGLFLSLDIILCVASTAGLIAHTEQTAASAARVLSTTGLPTDYAKTWLNPSEFDVSLQTGEPEGIQIPEFLQSHLPELTASGLRRIDFPDAKGLTFWQRLEGVTYYVALNVNGSSYLMSFHGAATVRLLERIFIILLIFELLMLLGSISSGARKIRKTLQPIEELAEAAQTLTTGGAFTPEELEVLAGKLDGINATRLDTRISVDGTQNELKTLASAINGMLDRINESYRSQARFVSDASHELRTPISVIQGYANLLDRWGKNDEKTLQESIDAIKEETANMKDLVEQLLFLARGDNNTMQMQTEHFELSALASEVLRETQMIDSGHEYDSNISPVFINADAGLIKQAMRILVDNAIKYTPTGKRISVSVLGADGSARLTVQDEGIGIPAEAVPRIFDRFYRADESRARATGGTGLGLSIAKWITERHGGHMEVVSREDIGTRISIVLPAAPQI